jgi:hypothetical protein
MLCSSDVVVSECVSECVRVYAGVPTQAVGDMERRGVSLARFQALLSHLSAHSELINAAGA